MKIVSLIRENACNKHFYYPFLMWCVVCLWFVYFSQGALDGFRYSVQDFFNTLSIAFSSDNKSSGDIVVVAIDNESIAAADQKWPFRRSYYSEILDNILSDGARVVVFDLLFAGSSEKESDDRIFEQSIASAGNVFLAYHQQKEDKRLLPDERFIKAARGAGHINKPEDNDGVVRKARMIIAGSNDYSYAVELHAAAYWNGEKSPVVYAKNGYLHAGQDISVPVDADGMVDLLYSRGEEGYRTISARRVINNNVPEGFFRDKIVLIGATARLIHDEASTPLGVMPGVYIIANTVQMILDGRYIFQAPASADIFLILSLGLLLFFAGINFNFSRSLTAFMLVSSVWFTAMLLFHEHGLRFDYGSHIFLIFSSFVVSNAYKYAYLMYMSDKVKRQAVIDPVTGFYTARYFSIMLGQILKAGSRHVCMLGIAVHDYDELSRQYSFENMKSFIRVFGRYLDLNISRILKGTMLTRSVDGRFFVLGRHSDPDKLKYQMERLVEKIRSSEFEFGTCSANVKVSIVIALFPEYRGITSRKMFKLIQNDLSNMLTVSKDKVFLARIDDKVWDLDQQDTLEDEMEFLSVDIEERNIELEKALREAQESRRGIEDTYFSVVATLVNALEEKDTYTQGHSERTAKYAKAIAMEVGLSKDEADMIYKAGLLHDIGKIGIPETLLHKTAQLSDEEFDLIKKHPVMGQKILAPIKGFEPILPIVLHHHERFDGRGYPHGLNGDVIPVGAQILAVADCFDAITCGRGYKHGTSLKEGMQEVERCSGTQFNPKFVDALKKVLNL